MSKLPRGWRIESLHYADASPRVGPRPSDAAIARASAIRLSYTPEDANQPIAHRTVHGARDMEQLSDLITRVVNVKSPV
jgi:hypothetical protein